MNPQINNDALQTTLDYLRARNTDEFLISQDGAIIVHDAFTDSPVTDVAAVQKALFAVMVGIAADRGIIQVDDPLSRYLPQGWTQLPAADEAKLIIRHILTMTTGMDDQLGPLGEIGVTWRYNNTAYNYLKRVLIEQTGQSLQALTNEWICEPLGLLQTRWIDRENTLPDGRKFTGLTMSGLDMAQLGQLVLNGGEWAGSRLVSESYWQAMLSPGSAANPAWCYMWWRNDQPRFMVPFVDKTFERQLLPEAPAELIQAQGAMDNRIYIDPTSARVIVRRGRPAANQGERHNFDRELWQRMAPIWGEGDGNSRAS